MMIRIGLGSCGMAAGALAVQEAVNAQCLQRGLDVKIVQTGCVGMCHNEPLIDVIDNDGLIYTYGLMTPEKAVKVLEEHVIGGIPVSEFLVSTWNDPNRFLERQVRVALRGCGVIDPESIRDAVAFGGYDALKKVLAGMSPEQVIDEVALSGLRGRGGAGFPTATKWRLTRKAANNPKYVVCNADEGDPGAFMDRSLLESDPHTLLEGMIIAGYAIGATQGIIYCRAEYPVAIRRLKIAIAQAYEHGFLGENILGSGFSLDIIIKQGAGAFVCGEETALIASIEGERGMPRLKPPYPSDSGYWGLPTNINNVETFANVPWIIREGGAAFAALGTEKSKGTKVFALAGKIKHGGLVEVPMGLSLREVVFDIGGGIQEDRQFKAVQLGGPSGGCIPERLLETPVDYDSINATGAIMGSGGMIVMDETTCMVDIARFFLDFTQEESCGKCVQCRIGTKRLLEILERIVEGEGQPGDIELLEDLSARIVEGSLCGLGQSAPNPVLTTIKYFRDEYEAHIHDKTCPAKQCKALIRYEIDPDKCKGCSICAKKCTVNAISGEPRKPYMIDQKKCTKCGNCLEVCPKKFDAVVVQ